MSHGLVSSFQLHMCTGPLRPRQLPHGRSRLCCSSPTACRCHAVTTTYQQRQSCRSGRATGTRQPRQSKHSSQLPRSVSPTQHIVSPAFCRAAAVDDTDPLEDPENEPLQLLMGWLEAQGSTPDHARWQDFCAPHATRPVHCQHNFTEWVLNDITLSTF